MTLPEKVDKGIEKLAEEIAGYCKAIADEPAGYTWEEVGDEPGEYPANTPVHQGQVYGSSYGPGLEQIVCDAIGLEEAEAEEVMVNAWGLADDLEDRVNSLLEEGVVFMDDNCLFYQLVEEAEENA